MRGLPVSTRIFIGAALFSAGADARAVFNRLAAMTSVPAANVFFKKSRRFMVESFTAWHIPHRKRVPTIRYRFLPREFQEPDVKTSC